MKNIKKYNFAKLVLLPLIAFAFLVTSCEIDKSINNSPNAINEEAVKSVTGVNGLAIALQVAAGDFYSGDRSRIASIWTRQMCAPEGLGRPQPVAWNTYSMQEDGPTDDMWKIGYRGVRIANDMINFAPEVQFATNNDVWVKFIVSFAKTYKALILGELAANYGSIPVEIKGLEPPKFVSQSAAYVEVQKLLDEAEAGFQGTTIAWTKDLNYSGDATKWLPVVYTLKARYYLHTKNYAKALEYSNKGMTAGALNAVYNNAPGEYSPWGHWRNTEAGEPLRGEATFVRLLKGEKQADGSADKRLAEYFTPNAADYWGYAQFVPAGADTNELNPKSIVSLKKYGTYDAEFPLVSANENMFILAESKFHTGDAAGATADLNTMRANVGGLAAFSGTGAALLTEIMLQKHLTLFLEGQTYTDMRRLKVLPEAKVPIRWPYPATEKNANQNVPADSDGLMEIW